MVNRKYIFGKVTRRENDNFTMNPVDLHLFFPKLKTFNVKRFYWISKIRGSKDTGQHAHRDEDGLFIVLQGKATIILDDDSKGTKQYKITEGHFVWIPRYVWHGLKNMSDDLIVLVLSNKNYDHNRKGYIENFQEFKDTIRNI